MFRRLLCLLLLIPTLVLSDVIIELTNGKRVVVPVDKEDVKQITFSESGDGGSKKKRRASAALPSAAESGGPVTWRVGPGRELEFPSDAAKVARDGDTIEIDAGVYRNDYVKWRLDGVTIRGVGGMAHLKSSGLIPNGKAIWIMQGDNTVIENIEFSGAAVRDTNGAGIRHERGKLVLRNAFFHHNEFSILTGNRADASLEISASKFWFQKRSNRYTHGIYVGGIGSFTLVGSHVKGTDQGHQVKSRARENRILYNRIEDVPGGNSSRLVDLANCGLSIVMGNDLHQAATTDNTNVIGYGAEKCLRVTEAQMRLFVINNTLVNEARNATFVNNHADGDVLVANNLVFGDVEMLAGEGEATGNIRMALDDRPDNSWAAPVGSSAVGAARKVKSVGEMSLVPQKEFNPPVGTGQRRKDGALDVGSRELPR